MEFEEQEDEQEGGEIRLVPSYGDSVSNSNPTRLKTAESPPARSLITKSKYKECLKNHAVGIGGHAVDGCGEFIPAGEDGTLESLKCAACSCHRNFHRKEHDAYTAAAAAAFSFHHGGGHFGSYRGPTGYLQVAPPRPPLLALPSTSGGGASELEDYYGNYPSGGGRKRFRTKFTAEQKEKMVNLAGRLGWRIGKQDEETVEEFCRELGIKRQVLKVWMHNNKHTLGKKP